MFAISFPIRINPEKTFQQNVQESIEMHLTNDWPIPTGIGVAPTMDDAPNEIAFRDKSIPVSKRHDCPEDSFMLLFDDSTTSRLE